MRKMDKTNFWNLINKTIQKYKILIVNFLYTCILFFSCIYWIELIDVQALGPNTLAVWDIFLVMADQQSGDMELA